MSERSGYGPISRINHWIVAIVIVGMIGFGLYLEFGGLPREAKGSLLGIHKVLGVLALGFALWRVAWRLAQGFPSPAAAMPRWQEVASKIVHVGLLAGILLMPVSGIASSVYGGRAVSVFGWFTLPAQAEIEWLAALAASTHTFAGRALALLVLAHVAAALWHHFIDADGTLVRMVRGEASVR